MARSGYQSQNKDWGEMYEHELEACAAELDSMIDGLIAEDNSNANKLAELKARYLHVSELNHNQVSMVRADAAERDRLAAENAELRKEADEMAAEIVAAHFANATLDALREAVPEGIASCTDSNGYVAATYAAHRILYPQPAALAEEKTNG